MNLFGFLADAFQKLALPRRRYRFDFQSYGTNTVVEANCASILFINQGDGTVAGLTSNPVTVNNKKLNHADSLHLTGDWDEEDKSIYKIVFDTSGGGTSNLFVIRKIYY